MFGYFCTEVLITWTTTKGQDDYLYFVDYKIIWTTQFLRSPVIFIRFRNALPRVEQKHQFEK